MATLADLLTSKIPPHSLEAERAVLGGMLLDRESLPKAVELLKPSDFYKEGHRKIFDAMLALYAWHGRHHVARFGRVLLVGERPRRNLDEARIGDVKFAVRHRPCHRFHEEPRGFGAGPTLGAEVISLEEVQHLEQGQAARGRTRGRDLKAAVGAPQRLGHVHLVPLEVFLGDEPPVRLEVDGDLVRAGGHRLAHGLIGPVVGYGHAAGHLGGDISKERVFAVELALLKEAGEIGRGLLL